MFDEIAQNICTECINGDDSCFGGSGNCPFWNEFEELQAFCSKAEELAGYINNAAHNDFWANEAYNHACGDY